MLGPPSFRPRKCSAVAGSAIARVVVIVGAVVAVAAIAALCGCRRGGAATESGPPPRLQSDGTLAITDEDRKVLALETTPAIEGDLPDAVLRFGMVRIPPEREALVIAPVAGRITEPVALRLGAPVAAGETLVKLAPTMSKAEQITLGAQIADVEGQIAVTEKELRRHELEAERGHQLLQSGLESPQNVAILETAVATSRAHLAALRTARAIQRGGQTGAVPLSSPIAGVVAAIDAPTGALLPSGYVLVRVVGKGTRWVDVAMPASEPVGTRFEVVTAPKPTPATLLARGVVAEMDGTRRDRLEVSGDPADALLPGAVIPVRVASAEVHGIIVLESALVAGIGTEYVFVEASPNHFVRKAVQVRARFGGQVRIAGEVAAGDKVVTQGALALWGEGFHDKHAE